MPHNKFPGLITTFYSYKGGVGRSMALANVAFLLAKSRRSVLCVDWDLEAPGMDYYFKLLEPTQPKEKGGLLSILEGSISGAPINWENCISSTNSDGCSVDFLGSGHGTPKYSSRVNDFPWTEFFEKHGGAQVIEKLRNEWKDKYEFILIDSRTGLTDSSGICTIVLPDLLVLIFSANEQSIDGCLKVAESSRRKREELIYDRQYLPIIPVLARFDEREDDKDATEWRNRIAEKFEPYFRDWIPAKVPAEKMLALTCLPHVARYSFGEKLAVKEQGVENPKLLGYYYQVLSRIICSRFRDVRDILISVGVKEAEPEPLLPEDISLDDKLRSHPEYVYERLEKFASCDARDTPDVLIAVQRLAGHCRRMLRLYDAEEVLDFGFRLARNSEGDYRRAEAHILKETAVALAEMGREDEAEEKYQELIAFNQHHFGDGDLFSLSIVAEFAKFLASGENSPGIADDIYKTTVNRIEKQLGVNDLRLAPYLLSFAEFRLENTTEMPPIATRREALELLRHAETIYRATAAQENNIANSGLNAVLQRQYRILSDMGRHKEAHNAINELVIRLEQRRHTAPIALIDAREQLAWSLEHLGEYKDAVEIYAQTLEVAVRRWGKRSVRYAITCYRFAEALSAAGEFEKVEKLFQEALHISIEKRGVNHKGTANIRAGLADFYSLIGHFDEAESELLQVLAIRKQVYGPDHRFIAMTYTHLALLYSEMLKWEEAENFLEQALKLDEKIFGPKHVEVAFDNLILARIISLQGNHEEKASSIWERELPILENALGPSNEPVARNRVNYAEHLFKFGKLSLAHRQIEEALKILRDTSGENHPYTKRAEVVASQVENELRQKRVSDETNR